MHRSARTRGFSVVELLVVIAIIAIVIALVVPGFSMLRRNAQAAKSLSNLRQWGIGYASFAHDHAGKLPWEGLKNPNQMPQNFTFDIWWANAIPLYVGQPSYAELSSATAETDTGIPLPPNDKSIFIDPAAELPAPPAGDTAFRGWIGGGKRFYFNYVPNAELNNHLDIPSIPEIERRVRLSQIRQPARTIALMEMRSVPDELLKVTLPGNGQNPFWNENLARHMGDWQRFAARHRGGGHMLFADGHAAWVSHVDACTPAGGTYGHFPSLDYNKPWLIWDPLGPTNENP